MQSNLESQVRKMIEADLEWVIQTGVNTPEFKTGTEATQFYSKNTLERWINDNNGVTLVAEINGQRVGFLLGYYMAGPNDGYINCTVVDQDHRRKGVGKMLQEIALNEFSQKGIEGYKCDHVFCVVNETDEAMIRLKKEAGFEIGDKFHYVEIMLPKKER